MAFHLFLFFIFYSSFFYFLYFIFYIFFFFPPSGDLCNITYSYSLSVEGGCWS